MPGFFKKAPVLAVSVRQRELLEQILRRPTSQQQHVLRARIIRLAADGQGNGQIAVALQVDRKTVYHWRTRWTEASAQLVAIEAETDDPTFAKAILACLSDAPRPGAPVKYTAETVCQIIAVACEEPQACGHPISHWTPATLRAEIITRGIVDEISHRQVGRFLKGGGSQAASPPLLGTPPGCGSRSVCSTERRDLSALSARF